MGTHMTLDYLIDTLQNCKATYGGNTPVLLSDGYSPNTMTKIEGVYIINMTECATDEKQTIILLTNLIGKEKTI